MPLLADGQDPDGLAARVAYHLHRLGIATSHLTQAEMYRDIARHIRRGSIELSTSDVNQLAAALQLDAHDLSRKLTDEEKAEWNFYRASARQVTQVWRLVAEATTAANYSQRQLATLLDIDQSIINRVMRGERKSPVLNWHDASKIAGALDLQEGADAFLPPDFSRENTSDRG